MTLGDMFGAGCGGIVLLLTLVQVAPIRCDPWGWLFGWLGRAINGEVIARVDELGQDVRRLNAELERQRAKNCRENIIRFGDELLHNELHSKEAFDQVLLDISEYERYCAGHPDFPNGVAVLTAQRIKDLYAECLAKHSFL